MGLDLLSLSGLSGLHGEHFVRLWFSGQVGDNLILPPAGIARHKLTFLREKLAEPVASGRRLDLHISHDWNVIILRELLLGVRHEEAGWAPFLDGVAFTADAASLRAFYRDRDAVVS